jgi:hypothetical protein
MTQNKYLEIIIYPICDYKNKFIIVFKLFKMFFLSETKA